MLAVEEKNPELLFPETIVKEELEDDYDNQNPIPSTSTYEPDLGVMRGIHATDIFGDTPEHTEIKDEVKEEEIDDYNYQGTSQIDSNPNTLANARRFNPTTSEIKEEFAGNKIVVPQPQFQHPVDQKKTQWKAECAPGWQNPVYIYKFLTINSLTGLKQMKCYTFSLNRMGFNIYICNYCKSLGTSTVIGVSNGTFLRDPLKLNHVCFPKLYEEEIRLRTNYSSPQSQAEGLAFLDAATSNKAPLKPNPVRTRKPLMLYDATVVQSRVGKNPTMYYRAYGDNNLCWSFMYQWERKNGTSIFVCAGCNKKDERVPIPVIGNKFCSDPSKLKHVCEPLYWPKEEEKLILREMKRKRTKTTREEAREEAEEEMCLEQLTKREEYGDEEEIPAKQIKLEEGRMYY